MWMFYAVYVAAHAPGLGIITLLPSVFASTTGVSEAEASSWAGVALAVYVCGRLGWGVVADCIGNRNAFFIFLLGQSLCLFTAPWIASMWTTGAVLQILLVMTLFGGATSTFGSYAVELFGVRRSSSAIGITITGFGVAGIVGPIACNTSLESTGKPDTFFYTVGTVAAAMGVLPFMMKPQHWNESPTDSNTGVELSVVDVSPD